MLPRALVKPGSTTLAVSTREARGVDGGDGARPVASITASGSTQASVGQTTVYTAPSIMRHRQAPLLTAGLVCSSRSCSVGHPPAAAKHLHPAGADRPGPQEQPRAGRRRPGHRPGRGPALRGQLELAAQRRDAEPAGAGPRDPLPAEPRRLHQHQLKDINDVSETLKFRGIFTRTEFRLVQPLFTFGKLTAGRQAAQEGRFRLAQARGRDRRRAGPQRQAGLLRAQARPRGARDPQRGRGAAAGGPGPDRKGPRRPGPAASPRPIACGCARCGPRSSSACSRPRRAPTRPEVVCAPSSAQMPPPTSRSTPSRSSRSRCPSARWPTTRSRPGCPGPRCAPSITWWPASARWPTWNGASSTPTWCCWAAPPWPTPARSTTPRTPSSTIPSTRGAPGWRRPCACPLDLGVRNARAAQLRADAEETMHRRREALGGHRLRGRTGPRQPARGDQAAGRGPQRGEGGQGLDNRGGRRTSPPVWPRPRTSPTPWWPRFSSASGPCRRSSTSTWPPPAWPAPRAPRWRWPPGRAAAQMPRNSRVPKFGSRSEERILLAAALTSYSTRLNSKVARLGVEDRVAGARIEVARLAHRPDADDVLPAGPQLELERHHLLRARRARGSGRTTCTGASAR